MAPLARTLVTVAIVLQGVLALPTSILTLPELPSILGTYIRFDHLSAIPEPWFADGPASPEEVHPFRIALKQQNTQEFDKRFREISTPGHPNYRKFMSADELYALLDPSKESTDKVFSWLKPFGIEATQDHHWIKFDLTISQAQVLLQTNYNVYRNREDGKTTVGTPEYKVPDGLHDVIDMITPTTFFEPTIEPYGKVVMTKRQQKPPGPPDCKVDTTPGCLQQLYGIPTTRSQVTPPPTNGMIVPGFLNEFASKADLAQFLSAQRPNLKPAPSFTVESVDNGRNDEKVPGYEATLDVQYSVGITNGIPVTFVSVGNNDTKGFDDLSTYILGKTQLPTVLAISYGVNEEFITQSVADNLCNSYKMLGARGVSVIYASGDGGVGGGRENKTCTDFKITFPASCPYVTSVGATSGIPEKGADLSTGGFSNLFPQPDYQAGAVKSYLGQLGNQYQGRFNASGRGVPDVSARGVNVHLIVGGKPAAVDGTSASSPIFGSIIALINDQLLAEKKPPLGFLNPFLYTKGVQGLNDILAGDNPSCGTTGFPAKSGWDPITGLGTPNYPKLLEAAKL
ncbi:peptidase S8/S53 domain-containing protein [Mortierella sp. GBAus27b]|nr:hypothetical protein BGX31_002835 [Mortierella sp. GBA43]KAI8356353.1 peptidase S8/S53 domain-containing protein [Mortierella sp. GBAus27b]